jgi:hypothetical protein
VKTLIAQVYFIYFDILAPIAVTRRPSLGASSMRYSPRRAIVHDLDSLVTSPMRVH